jgi:hypothetical protein
MATIGELKSGAVISKEEFEVPAAMGAQPSQSQGKVDVYVPKMSVEA